MNYVTSQNFVGLLDTLCNDYQVYVPVKEKDERSYRSYPLAKEKMLIGEVRAFEPLKLFFSKARERVADDYQPAIPESLPKPFALVGVKACDLKGFKVQDHVFTNHDYVDPFYTKLRKNNLIISADCTCVIDTCFCIALGLQPHPQGDFDLNLSQVSGGYTVEIGSEKGRQIFEKNAGLFSEAPAQVLREREAIRTQTIQEVRKNINDYCIPHQDAYNGIIEKNYESALWLNESKTCVECGACTIICPTCHCFLLYDQKNKEAMTRLRVWDSCMIKDYARVAGGVNPRAKLWMRLRNRFEKKFYFFPKVAGVYACTGCGRCVSACPAKIDIRKVLKNLVSDV